MTPGARADHPAIARALAGTHGPVEVRAVLELDEAPTSDARRVPALLAVIARGRDLEPVLLTAGDGGLRPALAGDGSLGALVGTWRHLAAAAPDDPPTAGTRRGRFRLGWDASADEPGLAGSRGGEERQVSTDHANLSLAVDGVLVKLLSRLVVDPDAALRVRRHLAAVAFEAVPPLLGWVSVALGEDDVGDRAGSRAEGRAESRAGDPELLVAVASRELRGAEEGWGRVRRRAEAHLLRGEDLVASASVATALGALLARFHDAMATPSPVLPAPVRQAGPDDRTRLVTQAEATLAAACAEVAGPPGDRLRAQAGWLRGWLAQLGAPPVATPLLHIHGDLHVGQVLWVDDRPVLTDLDGDAPDAAGPAAVAPPARDLAGLLRSLDHVGRLVAGRHPEVSGAAVTGWIRAVRAACRTGYLDTLAELGSAGLLDARLVAPFEVAQVAHELRYAARHLPDWLPVAEAALTAVIDEGGPPDGC